MIFLASGLAEPVVDERGGELGSLESLKDSPLVSVFSLESIYIYA